MAIQICFLLWGADDGGVKGPSEHQGCTKGLGMVSVPSQCGVGAHANVYISVLFGVVAKVFRG